MSQNNTSEALYIRPRTLEEVMEENLRETARLSVKVENLEEAISEAKDSLNDKVIELKIEVTSKFEKLDNKIDTMVDRLVTRTEDADKIHNDHNLRIVKLEIVKKTDEEKEKRNFEQGLKLNDWKVAIWAAILSPIVAVFGEILIHVVMKK